MKHYYSPGLLLYIFSIISMLMVVNAPVNAQATQWKASLVRKDGIEIPIRLDWKTEKGKPVWYIRNAAEKIRVRDISQFNDSLLIQMPVFESQFRIKKNGSSAMGYWLKAGASKLTTMTFVAGLKSSKTVKQPAPLHNITGRWAVNFDSNKPGQLSAGEFIQTGNKVTGTFQNATGDYRYLEGTMQKDSLLLSGFDGGHAFLFTAKVSSAQSMVGGVFYSGATYKEQWSATRNDTVKVSQDDVAMFLKPGEDQLNFSFKNLEGKTISIHDEQFRNKVVIIQLMGSWCPNCMDETAFLSEYYNQNKHRGVEVIALAYEYTTDWNRSVKSLEKFRNRYNVQYTILNTEVTVGDSLRTEKTLPQLTPIKFFPSSVILDKKGNVRKLDTGFNGPGTGKHFLAYKKEFEATINELLK